MHEFARRAKINVGTITNGYIRMGTIYHHRLVNYVNKEWAKILE